jgi:IMP dehydrogenase
MDLGTAVKEFMTPIERMTFAHEGITLKEANDVIWEHKLNALPIIDDAQRLVAFVFRKDYDNHNNSPLSPCLKNLEA